MGLFSEAPQLEKQLICFDLWMLSELVRTFVVAVPALQ